MLADDNAFIKAVAYGDKFKTSIMEGRTLAIRNFVFKDKCVKIISQTQVFRYVLHIFMKIQKVVIQFEGLLIVMVLFSNGQNAHL